MRSCLAETAVQIGFGVPFGVLFSKPFQILTDLDAAFIGAGSGLVSGLLGRAILICSSEPEEEAMGKIIFRIGNTFCTIGCAYLAQFAVSAINRWGNVQISIHDA